MSAPEAPDTALDTLLVEPIPSVLKTEDGDANSSPALPSVSTTALDVRKRFTELDGLRGVAALLVVVFHLRDSIRDLDPPRQLDSLLGGGYLMVDLFFVLSGFVLARMMLATRTAGDVARFSSLRARRFLPLHLTGVAIAFGCVALTWLTQHYGYPGAPHRPAFTTEQESPWGYLSAILLLQGFIGPHFAGYAAAWSLSIELWTNILLVVAIAAVPWARHKRLVGPAALGLGVLILFTLAEDGENSIGWTAFGRGLTGLGLGMVVYWAYQTSIRRRSPGPARWPAIGAMLGLVALLICMYYSRDLRHLQFVPAFAAAAGLIFCLAQPSIGPVHRLMNSSIGQWLGSRSFALYALHGSTLMAVKLASRLLGLHMHDPKIAILIIVTTLIAALTAAEVGHRFIERLLVPKKTG